MANKELYLAEHQDNRDLESLFCKEKLALDSLPQEIEELEGRIALLESDLTNPEKYQNIGITAIANALENLKVELDMKLEQYFALEQKVNVANKRIIIKILDCKL
ncbi:ABC transporter C-terminal domain-containing protein [Helicobacter equorum]|uniref:ABC transporter Uup C-terminal domain-containing protein n=1 Tax=Helicobacter equorum TaxID=361872 RepID=A0A3D8IRE7_9HELI|nr:hypothetical protein CQA54_04035 [Helicobacter equorum]